MAFPTLAGIPTSSLPRLPTVGIDTSGVYAPGFTPFQAAGIPTPATGDAIMPLGTIIGGAVTTAKAAYDIYSDIRDYGRQQIASNALGSVMDDSAVRPKRHRRKRLLTCGDKSDIAFLHGQLGSGALGKAAISALLSRRC